MHCLYRRRSELDDKLIIELTEASLSPYTRIRRHAQSVLHNVCGYFVRSTRFTLPIMFDALSKGNDADRIKGALYVLSNKGTAGYALADCNHHGRYLISILECQHEEKPSIQKLVNSLAQDCLAHLPEEAINTDSGILDIPRVEDALLQLSSEFSPSFIDKTVLAKALAKSPARIAKRAAMYNQTVSMILEIASRPTTHWRYVQMAERFLNNLLRRDSPAPPEVAKLFMEHSISPQPTISNNAQHAITKILTHAKMRAYSKSYEELWQDEWHNPLEQHVSIHDPAQFMESLQSPVQAGEGGVYVDKIRTGFLVWTANVKACSSVQDDTPPFPVDNDSLPSLEAISSIMTLEYFSNLCLLWSQESNKNSGVPTLRQSNLTFIKSLAKSFGAECLDNLLNVIDPLLFDSDKFKQRAGAEALGGLLRGSKHWPKARSDKLWAWTIERLGQIFSQVKPDTLSLWETVLSIQLLNRDPRRNQPLVNWILSLPLDFNGDSAFAMTKTLSIFGILVHTMGIRFNYLADKYVKLLFENANTSYAEVRTYVTHCLGMITKNQWQPLYPSTELLLLACQKSIDPLRICEAKHIGTVQHILLQLPKWRGERLPPPRVNQSEYDKVGLTLLQLIWGIAHSAQAPMIFPYVAPMMSEILRMSELNDSSDLQTYSSAVLYVLSAISPPQQYIEVILDKFLDSIKSSDSWRIRRHALPSLVVFTFRNLLAVSSSEISKLMDVLLDCLGDDNVEVREMASNALSGVVRCSQRHSIIPLKNRFVRLTKKISLPARKDPTYADSLRRLHSAILGLCALIESFPYSVEPWMPPLTEILAPHATDPPPISTTIRKCASEFKKTHQDTWHKDQQMFDENQLQSLSTMLVGTSYYA
jgi:proteasome activator subunit 4